MARPLYPVCNAQPLVLPLLLFPGKTYCRHCQGSSLPGGQCDHTLGSQHRARSQRMGVWSDHTEPQQCGPIAQGIESGSGRPDLDWMIMVRCYNKTSST